MLICCLALTACKKVEATTEEIGDVTLYRNHSYGRADRQIFDLCLPTEARGEIGLILLIHGGGWAAGDKEVYEAELRSWAERGYAVAALNYRYADKRVRVDEQLDDIKSCMSAIRSLGENHGVSIDRAILSGGSAGAHLSLMYAYKMKSVSPIEPVAVISYAGPTDLADMRFFEESEIRDSIDIMISKISGANIKNGEFADYIDKLNYASPTIYVSEDSVPTVICHGKLDNIVPYSNALTLDAMLTKYGVEHELIIYENSGHGLEADPECAERALELFTQYAERYLKKYSKEVG